MSKTVKQWLELLPPEIRDKALKQPAYRLNCIATTLCNALIKLNWSGEIDYWQHVWNKADDGAYDNNVPTTAPSDHDRMPKYSWNHVFAEGYNTYATDSDKFNDTEDCSY